MKTIYTAPTEKEGNGTEEYPFNNLRSARDAVRRFLSMSPGEEITVELAKGTYYLQEPLIFDSRDSGSTDAPVRWRSSGSAQISAGQKLVCAWEKYQGEILKCHIGSQVEGKGFSQLYVNGKRQILARFPNGDSRNPDKAFYAVAAGADQWPHKQVKYRPKSFTKKEWQRPAEAILHIFPQNHWGNMQYRLASIDPNTHTINLAQGGWQIRNFSASAAGLGDRSEFFVENVFEELDAPGEWYFDTLDGTLYWYPENGIDATEALIEVSRHKGAVLIEGSQQTPARNLTFEGLQFAHTERTFLDPYEIPSMGDWAIHRMGAVYISGAENIVVKNCVFDSIGGNAVFVDGYASHITVVDSKFGDIGESAVCFVGESHLNLTGTSHCTFCGTEHPWSWDVPSDNHPADCTVANNQIHDIGVFGKQTAGVFLALSQRIAIRHNHIYNTPRAAICINDGLYGGHLVEYNDIHDTVRETGDHGPFNSWGREPFWCRAQGHGAASHPAGEVEKYVFERSIIRHNRFRDSSGWGIDLDDGSSFYHVYGNLCIGISVKLREGVNRLVENNIFYKPVNPPAFHRGYERNNDRFVRNIVVMDSRVDIPEVDANFRKGKSEGAVYDIIEPPREGPWFNELDINLFYSDIGRFKALVHFSRDLPARSEEYSFENWQKIGFDTHSIFADPRFVDADCGDFTLLADSPAFELGFQVFPLDQFGPINNT